MKCGDIFSTIRIVGAALALTGLMSTVAHANTIFDPAANFEAGFTSVSNPNGAFSYGFSSTVTGPVTLYNAQVTGADSSNEQFWISSANNCCTASPAVGFNNGPAFDDGNVALAANQLDLVASVSQHLNTDLVFTAPANGNYSITSSFIGAQRGIGVGVDVVVNGSVLFSSTVTSFGQVNPFDDAGLSLSAGDTIEFVVSQGAGDQNTGLDATITELSGTTSTVPEPATLALFGMGLVGLGVIRRRRTA